MILDVNPCSITPSRLFSEFDALAGYHNVQKVETAGDCYIVAAGILTMDGEGFSEVWSGVWIKEWCGLRPSSGIKF